MPDEELKDDSPELEVSDDQLSSAFDSFLSGKEDVKVEEEEEVVEEKPTHSESTQLGRKVAKLFEKTDRLESKVATKDDLYDIMKRLDDIKTVHREDEIEEEYDEPDLSTREGIDRYLEKRELQKKEAEYKKQKVYSENYFDTMKDLLTEVEDKDVAAKVYNEMIKLGGEYNRIIYGNPERDCSKNFMGALKKITKEISKTPFSREVKDTKTGLSGSSTNVVSNVKPIKLSEDAAELAKRFNMTDEEIRKALEGDMPIGLRGKY